MVNPPGFLLINIRKKLNEKKLDFIPQKPIESPNQTINEDTGETYYLHTESEVTKK